MMTTSEKPRFALPSMSQLRQEAERGMLIFNDNAQKTTTEQFNNVVWTIDMKSSHRKTMLAELKATESCCLFKKDMTLTQKERKKFELICQKWTNKTKMETEIWCVVTVRKDRWKTETSFFIQNQKPHF